ncbi:hypothetical protein LSCM4_07306 [Leishmania orientalis]|uniref:FCP1 homology domain-containing protein n=1 Tax=Leishmania orientalis TaxID=2249476 RepID=A0A836HFB8_9TRYP|nr:hypothetical protein LSCM4_07306 [Leishmania orientalis]
MRRPVAALPVHLLLDIDHTLVHPICHHVGGDSSVTTGCSGASLLSASAGARWPLNHVGGRTTRVQLRPHVVPFLSHVLLHNLLDTSEVQVHMSLYTRQSAAYCAFIARQVLLPALAQHSGRSLDMFLGREVFHGLYGGEHCVRGEFEAMQWVSPPPGFPAEGRLVDESQPLAAAESREWRKTIFVSPSPLTTLLIDDRCANFRATELCSGHGVLVPSYYTGAEKCAADDCFRVPPSSTLCGAIDPNDDGRCGDMSGARAMLGRVDVADVVVRLLDVVEAFVHCCHAHRRTIEEIRDGSAGISTAHERALSATLRATAMPRPPIDSALSNFNFFDRSPLYQQQWNAFHADSEHLLRSYFTS